MAGQPISTVTVAGIDAQILTDPFAYGVTQAGPFREVAYLVDGAKAPKFCDGLKGIGNYVGTKMKFPAPHPYPGNPNLSCVSATLLDLKGPAAPSEFLVEADEVGILARYEALTWDAIGTDTEDFFGAGAPVPWSSVRVSHGHQEYVAEGISLANGGTTKRRKKRVPLVHYHVARTMIPDLAAYDALVTSLVGKLNSTTFCNKPRGTVLFDGLEMDPQEEYDPSGQRVYTFQTVAIYRPYDWNKELDTVANTFVLPASTSDYAYEYAELNLLLRYGVI